ncbi:MAG: hypothetical protein K8T20_15685 [Planctomycetes bacterium]|nr:hypothetical protein [Planctomycetota bacterium]
MNMLLYMLAIFAMATIITIWAKLASSGVSDAGLAGKTDSDRLDEIASRLEKIETAILNRRESAARQG